MENKNIITARNKKGETAEAAVARVQSKHPGKTVRFENPDTPPKAVSSKSTNGPDWLDDYARGVRAGKAPFSPENPDARGTAALTRIWGDIRPVLAEKEVAVPPEELPKDVSKWAVLPDWVELLERYPHTQRNVFDWMDTFVQDQAIPLRGGAAYLTRLKGHETARIKQYGQGFNDPTPAFTFHGERLPYSATKLLAEGWVKAAAQDYPDADVLALDLESLDGWSKVQGGRCATYVFAESTILYHGMTPHQETAEPIPVDVFWETWRKKLEEQFPGYGPGKATLSPSHLFVGTASSSGVVVGNMDGSGGYPYTNADQKQVRKLLNRPKFKGRTTKGKVFQHALQVVSRWIKAGMPMEGPEYEEMAQPATLAYRGDREVEMEIRALAGRGSDSSKHDASNRLAAMLPSRSVIIVPTCAVLAQSTWAQPLGNFIAGSATPGFDWVDPDHSIQRLDNLRQLDLQQADPQPLASVGADASGYDRDVTGQDHVGETAWYMAMFPQEARLLYCDAPLPMDVSPEWVQARMSELSLGETGEYSVVGILSDGSEQLQTVTAEVLTFDYWEYICKVMTIINDAPIRWADYQVDAPGLAFSCAPADPAFKGYGIVSNGGRRSGDGATGIGNTWSNLIKIDAGCQMLVDPTHKRTVERRSALQNTPAGGPVEVVDSFARGDDLGLVLRLLKGGIVPSEAVASAFCAVGMRANAKKQEASDQPGKPVFGFANVIVTENYMGKLLGRSLKRYMVQESRGLSMEVLTALTEVGNTTEFSDSLMATTSTAKSRLAPLAGFPLMDEHPVTATAVEWAVHNDEYRLSYVVDDSFDDNGNLTDVAKAELKRAADTEAAVQARLRAKRENVTVDLDRLKEAYAGSTIHDHVMDFALVKDYSPTLAMKRVNNHDAFKRSVREDLPLEI